MPGVSIVLDTNVYITYARYGKLYNLIRVLVHYQLNALLYGALPTEIYE